MTPPEVARILGLAAAYDQRTVGKSDVAAWHQVLADLDYPDAAAAVSAHYARTRDRLMPSDVREHVRGMRAQRLTRPLPAPPVDPDDVAGYRRALIAQRRAVAGARPELSR